MHLPGVPSELLFEAESATLLTSEPSDIYKVFPHEQSELISSVKLPLKNIDFVCFTNLFKLFTFLSQK